MVSAAKHEAALAELRALRETDLKEAKDEYSASLRDLRATNTANLKDARTQNQQALKALGDAHKEALAALTASWETSAKERDASIDAVMQLAGHQRLNSEAYKQVLEEQRIALEADPEDRPRLFVPSDELEAAFYEDDAVIGSEGFGEIEGIFD
jgi:hypothetical protein